MDSLTLLEGSYRKSRHAVDGEWHDKFRWCFGGDGGGGGGGGGEGEGQEAGYDVGMSATDQAASAAAADAAAADASGFDASAMAANAAAANAAAAEAAMDEAASMQSGFAGWGLSGLPGPGEEEDSYGYTGVLDYDTGLVDPAANLDSQASFSETFGKTPGQAVAEFADPNVVGRVVSVALGPLGLPSLLEGVLSTAAVKGAQALGAPESLTTGIMEQAGLVDPAPSMSSSLGLSNLGYSTMTGPDFAAEQAAQDDYTSQMARGGVVRLQNGIGSLYGRR